MGKQYEQKSYLNSFGYSPQKHPDMSDQRRSLDTTITILTDHCKALAPAGALQPFSLTPPDTRTNRLLCCHPFSSDTSCSSVHAIRTALSFIAFGKYSPYSIAKVIYSRLIPSCSFMHGYTNQYKTGCLPSQAAPLL